MPRLEEPVKLFIVERLACFDSPTEVAERVKEEFGVEVSRQLVRVYNPEQVKVTKKWTALHAAIRAAYLADSGRTGVAHQSYRLSKLQRLLEKAERSGNLVLAASLLEQCAKETGGAYTNRREVRGTFSLDQSLVALADEEAAAGEGSE